MVTMKKCVCLTFILIEIIFKEAKKIATCQTYWSWAEFGNTCGKTNV